MTKDRKLAFAKAVKEWMDAGGVDLCVEKCEEVIRDGSRTEALRAIEFLVTRVEGRAPEASRQEFRELLEGITLHLHPTAEPERLPPPTVEEITIVREDQAEVKENVER